MIRKALIDNATLLAFAILLTSNLLAQDDPGKSVALRAEKLFAAERWQEVIALVENTPARAAQRNADLDYYYGESLAKVGRLEDAHKALLAGYRLQSRDKRFAVELGGIEFLRKRYAESAHWLLIASKLSPDDAYVNDFCGSVFYLLGNVNAAVKYWNRVGKPRVESISTSPAPKVNPVLLDRSFAFARGSTLQLAELQATEDRLQALEIFPSYSLLLSARPDQNFDVRFRATERSGWGYSKLEAALSTFRGVFYQTLTPEYYNIHNSATNVVSLLRWDAQKRRAEVGLSGPLRGDPRWRYRLGVDLRGENWAIRKSFTGTAPTLAALNLRRESVLAEITSIHRVRWSWAMGAELSHRDFRDVNPGNALSPGLLQKGYQLKHTARLQYRVLDVPERRLTVSANASTETGRYWSNSGGAFFKPQAGIAVHWFPHAQGDDLEMQHRVKVGDAAGTIPFDELYMLGLERDNDLMMRAHIGTRDGRKGSAPLGRRYFLSNWEMDKNLYSNGLIAVKLGPFVDTGNITGQSTLGSQKWLWDAGVQAKVSALGVKFVLSYGRDLRGGKGAFYARATR